MDFHSSRWDEGRKKAAEEFIKGLDVGYNYYALYNDDISDFARSAANRILADSEQAYHDELLFNQRADSLRGRIAKGDSTSVGWILKIDFSFHIWRKYWDSALESAIECMRFTKPQGWQKRYEGIIEIFKSKGRTDYVGLFNELKKQNELDYVPLTERKLLSREGWVLFPVKSLKKPNQTLGFAKIHSDILDRERKNNLDLYGISETNQQRTERQKKERELEIERKRLQLELELRQEKEQNFANGQGYLTNMELKKLIHERDIAEQRQRNYLEIGRRVTDADRLRDEYAQNIKHETEKSVFFNPDTVEIKLIREIRVQRWQELLNNKETSDAIFLCISKILNRDDVRSTFKKRLKKYAVESDLFNQEIPLHNTIYTFDEV
jgi:hypothetical protein